MSHYESHTHPVRRIRKDTVLGTRLTRRGLLAFQTERLWLCKATSHVFGPISQGLKRNDLCMSRKQPTQTRQATPPSLPDAVTFQHLITAANDENLVVPCQRIWVRHGLSRNEG